MERIMRSICATQITFPINVFLFYLRITYTNLKVLISIQNSIKIGRTNFKDWAKLEEKHPNTFKESISSGFLKFLTEYSTASKFNSLFVVSAPKFTLIEARRA